MTKLKIKKGDKVVVISGGSKGKEGEVLQVFPDKNKAIVEGVNVVSKHKKPSAKNPQGGIVKSEALFTFPTCRSSTPNRAKLRV